MANVVPNLTVAIVGPAAGPTRVSYQTSAGGQGDLIIALDEDNGTAVPGNWSAIVSAVVSAIQGLGISTVTSDTVTVT